MSFQTQSLPRARSHSNQRNLKFEMGYLKGGYLNPKHEIRSPKSDLSEAFSEGGNNSQIFKSKTQNKTIALHGKPLFVLSIRIRLFEFVSSFAEGQVLIIICHFESGGSERVRRSSLSSQIWFILRW